MCVCVCLPAFLCVCLHTYVSARWSDCLHVIPYVYMCACVYAYVSAWQIWRTCIPLGAASWLTVNILLHLRLPPGHTLLQYPQFRWWNEPWCWAQSWSTCVFQNVLRGQQTRGNWGLFRGVTGHRGCGQGRGHVNVITVIVWGQRRRALCKLQRAFQDIMDGGSSDTVTITHVAAILHGVRQVKKLWKFW